MRVSFASLVGLVAVCSVLCLSVFVSANDDPTVSLPGVIDLTPENFDTLVGQERPALVEFYAPWCGHCKSLVPEYARLGELVTKGGADSRVLIAKVNADKYRELGGRFDVKGFPTLKWFPKGSSTAEEYTGGRSAEDFVQFINEKADTRLVVPSEVSAAVEMDPSSLESAIASGRRNLLVMFYAPWCGHCKRLKPEWERLAQAFASEDSVVIARVDADKYRSVGEKFDIKGYPTLKFFAAGASTPEAYSGARTLEALVNFVNEKAGTHRRSNGRLDESVGRVAAMAPFVTEFLESSDKASVVDRALSVVTGLTGEEATVAGAYLKIMEKMLADEGYARRQKSRLERLVDTGAVEASKIDEFTRRINVLSLFAA